MPFECLSHITGSGVMSSQWTVVGVVGLYGAKSDFNFSIFIVFNFLNRITYLVK